jgi:hypothetical protein
MRACSQAYNMQQGIEATAMRQGTFLLEGFEEPELLAEVAGGVGGHRAD